MNRDDTTLRASALFHRALIVLFPAASLSLISYEHGFRWYLTAPALLLWAAGAFLLKRGSDRWRAESTQSR